MDCLHWNPDILNRDPNSESEYSEDALDKLISCAKLLTDDIRQITSFIKVKLIFNFYDVLLKYITYYVGHNNLISIILSCIFIYLRTNN